MLAANGILRVLQEMERISVVICTFNGARTLPRLLEHLKSVESVGLEVEIIFVDNASTDETAQILANAHLPWPTVIKEEPRPGKSYALNTGIAAATGSLVVFADDDILPAPTWLRAYYEAARNLPEVIAFAGQVRPRWDAPAPKWLLHLSDKGRAFGSTPVERNSRVADAKFWQFKGANMMVRSATLNEHCFDTEHLNFAANSAGGEDTGLIKEILGTGQRGVFVPDACVQHIIRPDQISLRTVWQREVRIGMVRAARQDYPHNKLGPVVLYVPVKGMRTALSLGLGAVLYASLGRSSKAAEKLVALARLLGEMKKTLAIRKQH
ncbi:glycosyltransferase [Actibacterium lipolyticum]|uniref:Undecaprenyl-phosphate 4-deoxy-4-formamido-L-arabinose transferase n=1 Tax=Actibacterium lipolyticum TaxID=1524263 RepID=A0A238JMQ4_9RHOB|nr:glycosyltransferase [Actibacterium lipolyticum]SMX31162.1 Undecaprenyl-phosphate 4-deoxy-4-formamido-L-arabinose transferase [Actibacterium lipolyticum]